jgi:hypothetical protein
VGKRRKVRKGEVGWREKGGGLGKGATNIIDVLFLAGILTYLVLLILQRFR